MVRFNLDIKKKQESPIFLSLFHHGRRLRVYTGKKIDASKWDAETRRANPRNYKTNCIGFNKFLQDIDDAVTSLINENKPISKADLISIINKTAGKESPNSFFGFSQGYLSTQLAKGEVKPISAKGYQTALNHLKEFNPSLNFQDIDLNFYDKFVIHLKNKGLSTNSIGANVKRLKWFLAAAMDRDLHNNVSFKKKSFKSVTEETDETYLTRREVKQLLKAKLPATLRKVADAFILNCSLGQRYSDWAKMLPDNFSKIDGRYHWNFIQQKGKQNRQIPVSVPVPDEIYPLLKKYNFTCPVIRTQGKHNGKLMTIQKFNEYLQTAAEKSKIDAIVELRGQAEKMPKFSLISSHTARRSFATNLYLEDVPIQNIMAITGHKRESTFLLYVRADQLTKSKGLAKHYEKSKPVMKVTKGGKAA